MPHLVTVNKIYISCFIFFYSYVLLFHLFIKVSLFIVPYPIISRYYYISTINVNDRRVSDRTETLGDAITPSREHLVWSRHDGKRSSRPRKNILDEEKPCLARRQVSGKYGERNSRRWKFAEQMRPDRLIDFTSCESHRSPVGFDSTSTELRVRVRENDSPEEVFACEIQVKEKTPNVYRYATLVENRTKRSIIQYIYI